MTRVKRKNVAKKKRNKVSSLAKGFVGGHSRLFRTANQQVMKSLRYAFADRRKKKNQFRSIWIIRLKAIVRRISAKYAVYIRKLKNNCISWNKKMLDALHQNDEDIYNSTLTYKNIQ